MEAINDKKGIFLEAIKCPVCFGRLHSPLVCCISGHAFCQQCYTPFSQNCPVCRQKVSLEKPITLSNLIDSLPAMCMNNGCSEFTWNLDDHKKLCDFRATTCRICQWSGSVKELYEHLDNSTDHITIGDILHFTSPSQSYNIKTVELTNFNYNGYMDIGVCKIEDQYFWRIVQNNQSEKTFNIMFLCIPRKEVNKSYWIKVIFKTDFVEYNARVKLSFDLISKDSNQNFICFNNEVIKNAIPDIGKIDLKIEVESGDFQQPVIFGSQITTPLENLSTLQQPSTTTKYKITNNQNKANERPIKVPSSFKFTSPKFGTSQKNAN